jgi:hypothetical protein
MPGSYQRTHTNPIIYTEVNTSLVIFSALIVKEFLGSKDAKGCGTPHSLSTSGPRRGL